MPEFAPKVKRTPCIVHRPQREGSVGAPISSAKARSVLSLPGAVQVTLDGEACSFRTAKVQALLAYLAVEADRPHRLQVLAGLL